jgi:hypothetical protein
MPLTQMIYVSKRTNLCNTEKDNQEIEASSIANNALNNITGALICTPKYFIQVLEGRYTELHNTYDRILCDRRHCHAEVKLDRQITQRSFGNWAMNVVLVPSIAYRLYGTRLDATDINPARLTSDTLIDLFGCSPSPLSHNADS